MICPKCGFEQPDSPECARCGIIVGRYKGPVFSGATAPASPSPPMAASAVGTVFGDPEPALAGGAVYGGPTPGGATVYNGPPPGSAAASAMAAPQTLAQPRGTLGVGDVLGQTFSIFFANLLPFALLTAICLAPLFVLLGYATTLLKVPHAAASPAVFVPLLLVAVGVILCPYLATGAITYGVFQQLRGQDTTIGDCLGRGLSALLPVLGLVIVQTAFVLLGFVFCIVPGILFSLRWAVTVPTMVTERTGIFESMERSKLLTEGSRGEVFLVLFVLGMLNFGSSRVVSLVAAGNPNLSLILSGVLSLFTVGLTATGSAVMYYRLRSAKESIDVDQIASVFA